MQENNQALPMGNPAPGPGKSTPWMALVQLILSIAAGLGFWGIALTFVTLGALAYFALPMAEPNGFGMNAASLFLMAASLFWMGILVFPSAYYAAKRIGRTADIPSPEARPLSLQHLIISLAVLSASLWLGNTFGKEAYFTAFILPFLHILAISLPIFWTAVLGSSGIPPLKMPRAWGVLAASLTLGPFLILMLEIVAMILLALVGVAGLLSHPAWMQEISHIGIQLTYAKDQAELERIILPFLVKPGVIIPLGLYVALIVPLIEEALKPIAVWLLLPAGLNGRQGFLIGLLCGAGYALFESLLLATASSDWLSIVIGRAATGLLHIANCGLVGWALAEAFGVKPRPKGAVRRLWGAYFLAVILHGLWNGLTVFALWATLAENAPGKFPDALLIAARTAPYGLVGVTLAAFFILFFENTSMRRRLTALQISGSPSGDSHTV